MQLSRKLIAQLTVCLLVLSSVHARRVRVRPKPVQREESEEISESEVQNEEDNRPQSAIQYYSADSSENIPQQDRRLLLVSSNDEYNGYYGQPTARPRADYNRPNGVALIRGTTPSPPPRTKDQATKPPPVQTIRNYSKVNDDGSFTFGYEAADGSFKEETRGTDCVVRGKYGYIDPDGNKREFTYVSGNPCDPNNPDGQGSEEDREVSEEDSREPENVPQNYPKRPIRPVRPVHTTTSAPTTVFQSSYSHPSLQVESEEEEPESIQVLQPQRTRAPAVQPIHQYRPQQEVSIRQRPRITINTTPTPISQYQAVQPVSITPRPTYRAPVQTLPQTQPPPTTYRPANKVSQQPVSITYSKSTSRPSGFVQSTPNAIQPTTRRPIDFAAELQKFQKEHNVPITTSTAKTTSAYRPFKPAPTPVVAVTSNPIYESQLIYDPNSGQYDSALYQQLPQTEGEFHLNHKIQPYVHPISSPAPQLVSLEQLAHINPLYRRSQPQPSPVPAQYSQQIYEKERENLQVLNSQQLFQQQQELQQQQLQQDRLEAARKATQQAQQQHQQHEHQQQQQRHRFQPSPVDRPLVPQSQGFYYIQPPSGQLDAFIRGHNFDF